jgi:hypothetical protein
MLSKLRTKFAAIHLLGSCLAVVLLPSFAFAEPRLNAPRVPREPGWSGPARLNGTAKEENEQIPILERSYRPGHVYGNMTRRHHYRGTIIPSHRDRVEMLEALISKEPVPTKFVKDKYR